MTEAGQQSKRFEEIVAGGQPPATRVRAFAGLGLFSGFGAVAAKSCCLLPLVLASSGLGGAWLSQELITYRPYFLAVAWIAVAAAWLFAVRRRRVACAPGEACNAPAKGQGLALLTLSTLTVGLATIWEWIEPILVALLLGQT